MSEDNSNTLPKQEQPFNLDIAKEIYLEGIANKAKSDSEYHQYKPIDDEEFMSKKWMTYPMFAQFIIELCKSKGISEDESPLNLKASQRAAYVHNLGIWGRLPQNLGGNKLHCAYYRGTRVVLVGEEVIENKSQPIPQPTPEQRKKKFE